MHISGISNICSLGSQQGCQSCKL